eukprot:TRINITY_DN73973_c0_g1_i1.p1 TRINITY_DN73973_c0_g1~~TRINITY_DN73973_c0_g1_i1.p1  ORF type:complete len:302 (-),score=69.23 TRINITY_DN73973_c0_g1_i1:51-956(-)
MDSIRGLAEKGGLVDPFQVSTVPHLPELDVPRRAPSDDAWTLTELYRSMLDILTTSEAELEADQERLALMLSQAQSLQDPAVDIQVFLLHEGIELRLRELNEECRRLAIVELRLERCIDEAEAQCEIDAVRTCGLVDPRLLDKLVDQRRVIRLQQQEMDQIRFDRDVLADDAARLREEVETFAHGDADGEGGAEVATALMMSEQRRAAELVSTRAARLADAALEQTQNGETPGEISGAADTHRPVDVTPPTATAGARPRTNPLLDARPQPKRGPRGGGRPADDGVEPLRADGAAASPNDFL